MKRALSLTAGFGTGVAILAAIGCMLIFIWTGDEAWSESGRIMSAMAGVPFFVAWLGYVKRNS